MENTSSKGYRRFLFWMILLLCVGLVVLGVGMFLTTTQPADEPSLTPPPSTVYNVPPSVG